MNKVYDAIARYQMFQRGDAVVIGVSGGADSTALLDFLCTGLPDLELKAYACHINHQLRGEESDQDEAFVRQLCEKYGVRLFCFTENVAAQAAERRQSVELAAREIRYRHFERLADRLGAKIATAHTLSDSMETMLYHLARGTGIKGLGGIPPVRGRIVRPLIGITRAQVEDYLRERGISYRTDSSNRTDAYARNRIRHRLVPEFYRLNPSADLAAAHLQQLLRETEEYLEEQASAALEQNRVGEAFCLNGLRALPVALRRAALMQLLRDGKVEPGFAKVERLLSGMEEGRCCIELRRGLFFVCEGGLLSMKAGPFAAAPAEEGEAPLPLFVDGNVVQIQGKTLCFLHEDYEHFKNIENIEKSLLKNLVDYDKIGDNAVVRTRRAGDRFTHPVRHWTKTLKKLFNEYHIPPEERESILVCADDAGVFWVEGFGTDARVLPGSDTKRVLKIKMLEESERCMKTS